MKKSLVFLSLCMIFAMNIYATVVTVSKNDTVITTNIDTVGCTSTVNQVERLVDKYSDKIAGVITSLAEQLKVPAEHVYNVYKK